MRRQYPVSVSCEVLEVGASGYFNWLHRRESGQGGPAHRLSDEALLDLDDWTHRMKAMRE